MKKSEFEEIERKYLERRKRLESIAIGSLVWEEVGRFGDNDYHPAVVKSIDVDEDYVEVVDVSYNNEIKQYSDFLTESEMIRMGFSKENIAKEYEKYADVIKRVKQDFS